MPSRQDYFDKLAAQARAAEAGGLTRERSVLLLWFLRNVVGVDTLDAYDYVCDGPDDWGVDGLFLEPDVEGGENERLAIFQSKYVDRPRDIGKPPIDALTATAAHFASAAAIEAMLRGPINVRLEGLIRGYGLLDKVRDGSLGDGRLRMYLVLVTTGRASREAKAAANAANLAAGREDYVVIEDIDALGPIAIAVDARQPRPETIEVAVAKSEVTVIGDEGERVAVMPVAANDIITWPGIDDRSLFDLNVRRALKKNRVYGELDRAIARPDDHGRFLSYHNGLTVVCDRFEVIRGKVRIIRPSVVNGAQSVIAFDRNATQLTPELRVFVKLVEVSTRPNLAREVSRRSNTQNPVNPRMLMANSGPQLRLEQEFTAQFPGIDYVTRPDAEIRTRRRTINNDDAAQLLTAVFLGWPWLAVKRTTLFESENHALIFRREHGAAHIVLADEVGAAVDRFRTQVPEFYRGSWKLTRIVMAYLVGQILRSGESAGDHGLIANPISAFERSRRPAVITADARARLDDAANLAALALTERFDARGEQDDYRANFKNETELRGLGAAAAGLYRLRQRLPAPPAGGA